jgi:hypothetical protein
VVRILNSREIYIDGKPTGFTPEKINSDNLEAFVQSVYKVSPALFFSQFSVDSRLVKFKYPVGLFVRAKLLVTSAAAIGEKRSATNLTLQSFEIVEQIPYIAKDLSLGRAYKCKDLKSEEIDIFDEKDLFPTVPENERFWNL